MLAGEQGCQRVGFGLDVRGAGEQELRPLGGRGGRPAGKGAVRGGHSHLGEITAGAAIDANRFGQPGRVAHLGQFSGHFGTGDKEWE